MGHSAGPSADGKRGGPKIVITRIKQEKSGLWESMDHVLMSLINNECQGYDWIIEVQADEYFHPQVVPGYLGRDQAGP